MNFSSINIQGNIISSDILTKIAQDDIRFQKPSDFGLNNNTLVRDEIGIAWSLAQAHWKAFVAKREQLRTDDTGTSLTRQSWVVPLLQTLGYDLQIAKAEIINEKSYAISHRAINKDGFPIHIVGVNQSLDKRAEFGARLSPHALVQEYLNNHDHLYAFTTNGSFLRVLRDATRLSRLSYLEFNLERMMEEELYAEFAILFRVLHATRISDQKEDGAECIFEFYHQEALASGTRIRERLSGAVEKSIRLLGNGLLQHPANSHLREKIDQGLTADQYYLYILRTVYRMLFLLVIEERHLIYPEKRDEDMQKKRRFYYDFYSLQRLTKLVERRVYVDPRKTDLWDGLLTTFKLFEKEEYGSKLGLQALASGLFAPGGIGLLGHAKLDNETLLQVLRNLVMFENENKQWTRVNYADLDVEEFGSVYEGLLEYEPVINLAHDLGAFSFVEGTGRSSSGSHYTPEELVKPLIKHSLDYIIEDKLKEGKVKGDDQWQKMEAQCEALLTVTVCDVACGSGHILLSAARRIGMELAILRESLAARSQVEQPSPTFLRQAIRDVIRFCIYGVDLNPLAVELCKVALWLEAHNPGEPLNFLDHHIKCGNSIVGLAHLDKLQKGIAEEAFKTLPGDDKETVKYFRDKNKAERKNLPGQFKIDPNSDVNNRVEELAVSYNDVAKLPEQTPAEVEAKAEAYEQLMTGSGWLRLKQLADMQVAQFFIPKTEDHEDHLLTDGDYRSWLNGKQQITGQAPAYAASIGAKKRFFHWFLEFPTVMQNGGFDCILGNPPFLGGTIISSHYGNYFLNYLHSSFVFAGNRCDLVAYFFRQTYSIIRTNGFISLISSNTISQGDTREGGLKYITNHNGDIIFAISSMKWPGLAAVEVSLVSIFKNEWEKTKILNNSPVEHISSFLDSDSDIGEPLGLNSNTGLAFNGSKIYGDGFIITKKVANELISKNPRNKEVIFPYLNGKDLNTSKSQSPSRYVINFFDWNLKSAKSYGDCFEIIESNVKSQREDIVNKKKLLGKTINDDDIQLSTEWWKFQRYRPELYRNISKYKNVLAISRVTKYTYPSYCPTNVVASDAVVVIALESYFYYGSLTSTLFEIWAWKYASTMGGATLRYSPSDCFINFPFPNANNNLESISLYYHKTQKSLLNLIRLGLTKCYNAFHTKEINPTVKSADLEGKTNKEIEKQYGKEAWNLWNHLQKNEGTCSLEEAVAGIEELRRLHVKMDKAVLEAYGWHEDSEKWGKAINLAHDFYEVDYLPENDRVRFTISPKARKEVLKRLLLLNHERYEEEILQGLHKKKDVEAFYAQKGKPVPEDVEFSDQKPKKRKIKKEKIPTQTTQRSLFDDPNTNIMKEFGLHDGIYSIRDTAEIINQPYSKVRRWFLKLSEANYEGLSDSAKTDIENRRVCFHGLVELVVIGELLEAGVKPKSIFVARKDLSSITKQPYPFATSDVKDKLKVSGSDIVFDFDEGLVTLDGSRQFNLDFIREFFADIVFESRVAIQLLPAKGHKRIQINPKAAGGRPAFMSRQNVTVETIVKFYNGPDSMDEIVEDYGITKEDVEAALAYQS